MKTLTGSLSGFPWNNNSRRPFKGASALYFLVTRYKNHFSVVALGFRDAFTGHTLGISSHDDAYDRFPSCSLSSTVFCTTTHHHTTQYFKHTNHTCCGRPLIRTITLHWGVFALLQSGARAVSSSSLRPSGSSQRFLARVFLLL
jgi:hypothetical protein